MIILITIVIIIIIIIIIITIWLQPVCYKFGSKSISKKDLLLLSCKLLSTNVLTPKLKFAKDQSNTNNGTGWSKV